MQRLIVLFLLIGMMKGILTRKERKKVLYVYQGEALRGGIEGEGGRRAMMRRGSSRQRVARDDGGERVLTGE